MTTVETWFALPVKYGSCIDDLLSPGLLTDMCLPK